MDKICYKARADNGNIAMALLAFDIRLDTTQAERVKFGRVFREALMRKSDQWETVMIWRCMGSKYVNTDPPDWLETLRSFGWVPVFVICRPEVTSNIEYE